MNKSYVKNAAAILAVTLVAGLSMSVASAESGYTHTRTLKVGSRGLAVESLQEALNSCWDLGLVADGIFGKGTAAAVKEAQRDLGVKADGIVGPITGGDISDCEPMDEESDNEETSNNNNNNNTNTSGTITGPEGNISNVSKLGAYNNTKVPEGTSNVEVYAVELTAKDGDQKIDGFNVAFKQTAVVASPNTPSNKITRYISEISIWLDGKEIGRKVAAAYSDDANDMYTYRFTAMNGIIKKDMKGQLVVRVTPVTSFDSIDANNEVWKIEAGTSVGGTNSNYISAMSANGRFRDYGSDTSESIVDFQKAGTASSDQKFRVNTAGTNPVAQTVQASRTSDTAGRTLLAFDVKAENGSMIIQRIPVTITTTNGGADGVAPNPEAIIKTLSLYANGTLLTTESIPSGTSTQVVTFGLNSKLQYKIASNATVKFEVKADLNDIEDTGVITSDFDEGDKINVSYTTTNVTNSTVELDNFSQDSVQNRSGSAIGENQTARSTGMQVVMGAATTEATTTEGEILSRRITIPVAITAFDDTVYVNDLAENALTPTATAAVAFTFEDAAGATKTIANSAAFSSSDATMESGAYRVDSGSTKNFKLVIIETGTTTHAQKLYRVQLNKFQSFTDAALTAGTNVQDATPLNAFETDYYGLNLN